MLNVLKTIADTQAKIAETAIPLCLSTYIRNPTGIARLPNNWIHNKPNRKQKAVAKSFGKYCAAKKESTRKRRKNTSPLVAFHQKPCTESGTGIKCLNSITMTPFPFPS